jgi:hypothetical protein
MTLEPPEVQTIPLDTRDLMMQTKERLGINPKSLGDDLREFKTSSNHQIHNDHCVLFGREQHLSFPVSDQRHFLSVGICIPYGW